MFEGTLSNVLIVENESGEVFIVENKNRKKPKVSEKKVEENFIFEPVPEKKSKRRHREDAEDLWHLDENPVAIK